MFSSSRPGRAPSFAVSNAPLDVVGRWLLRFGITVWISLVTAFGFCSVGKMAHFTTVAVTVHSNCCGLTLGLDCTIVLPNVRLFGQCQSAAVL